MTKKKPSDPLFQIQKENYPIYVSFAVLFLFTIFTRFWDLGAKPPHHDESMHAFYSLQLLKDLSYEYNPMLHGPFQFHGNAFMFLLFGDSTAVSRYLAALFGVMAVALTFLMTPILGRTGSLVAAALMAFSPGFMYFSRFCREDIFFAVSTLAFVVFLYRYLKSQKTPDLCLASVALGIAYGSKEAIFLTLFIFGFYTVIRTFVFLMENITQTNIVSSGLGVLIGNLKIGKLVLDLLLGTFIFVNIFLILFTAVPVIADHNGILSKISTFFHEIFNGLFGGLAYWWQQHGVRRGDQPWYYYFLQLIANEPVVFFFSIAAAIYHLFFKRKEAPLFFAFWYFFSVLLYMWFGEKMPWLTLHILLPGLLLTACFVDDIWDSIPKEESLKILRGAALALFGVLLCYSWFSAVRLSFPNAANPVETYVYVQSSPECLEVEKIIRKISWGETGGPQMLLTIEDKCSWPFAWQFHDYQKRNHPTVVDQSNLGPIILTATESDDQEYPFLVQQGYVNQKFKLRCWWVTSWFKGDKGSQEEMTFGLFWKWFWGNLIPLGEPQKDMVDWGDLWRWIAYREVWSTEGSYNMRLWVWGDLAKKYGFEDNHRSDIPDGFSKPAQ